MTGLLELAGYLLLGTGAGILAGLLGVGGGVVIVPALVWVFSSNDFDPSLVMHLAVGTSLATIVITSVASIRAHQRHQAIRWPVVRRLAAGILLGAGFGALVADALSSFWLQRVFACFIILVGIRMASGAGVSLKQRGLPGRLGMFLSGVPIGLLSALVGIGGGSLTVPFLNWCGVDMRHAVATSAACGLPIALAGATGFVLVGWGDPGLPPGSTGFVYWPALLGIVATSFPFAPLGARLAHTLPVKTLKRAFAVLLLVLGVKMLVG